MPDRGHPSTRLSFGENLFVRLVGLLLVVAPNRGSDFLIDAGFRVAVKARHRLEAEQDKALAA